MSHQEKDKDKVFLASILRVNRIRSVNLFGNGNMMVPVSHFKFDEETKKYEQEGESIIVIKPGTLIGDLADMARTFHTIWEARYTGEPEPPPPPQPT